MELMSDNFEEYVNLVSKTSENRTVRSVAFSLITGWRKVLAATTKPPARTPCGICGQDREIRQGKTMCLHCEIILLESNLKLSETRTSPRDSFREFVEMMERDSENMLIQTMAHGLLEAWRGLVKGAITALASDELPK